MLQIEMDIKYLGTWFIQDFGEVLKKIYEMNRLHWKAKNSTQEEAGELKAREKEINKEYDKAYLIGIEALETMRGTHCSFTVDENEKVFGIVESKYHPEDGRYMQDRNWVIKIHDEKMEPLMQQRLQESAMANSLDRNCTDIQNHD